MIFSVFKSFFLRDYRQNISYKFAFFMDLGSIFFKAATFYFVAKLLSGTSLSSLEAYGGLYFPFVLIGIAFSTYQTTGLTSFSQSIRQEQFLGTLESILVTPVPVGLLLAGSALWDFFYATVEVLLYFMVGFLAFGLLLPSANWGVALVSLFLTLTSFMGLGILSAAFILRFKKGSPVTWLVATVGELLGGVYFPTDILPSWLKKCSDFVPMSHALEALRQSLLGGAGLSDIQGHITFLALFSIGIWTLGILAFQWALKASRADGSLSHY